MTEQELIRCENRLFSRYKAQAKKRGKEFNLNQKEFIELSQSPCAFCGGDHSNSLTVGDLEYSYNGLDRVDSAIGYTRENVVSCCRFCNTLKASMPFGTWVDFLKGVVETDFPSNVPNSLHINRKPKRLKNHKKRGSKAFWIKK